jgi:hypothetical protein
MASTTIPEYNVRVRQGKDIGLTFSTTLNSDRENFEDLSPSTTPFGKEKGSLVGRLYDIKTNYFVNTQIAL